jgi:type IV pilus assembly protein PilE
MIKRRETFGFTLVELIFALVIIAILSAVAVGLFRPYTLKTRRVDGINAILNLQLTEERYRSTNTQYGSLAQIGGSGTSTQGYYTLTITNTGATTYTITATGVGAQANDAEGSTACSPLVLTVNGLTVTPTPAACWPS